MRAAQHQVSQDRNLGRPGGMFTGAPFQTNLAEELKEQLLYKRGGVVQLE